MTITIGSSTLCDGATRAVDKSCGPVGLQIDGRQAVQPVAAIRAAATRFYDRLNHATTISFSVAHLCADAATAAAWALTHAATVARSGTLTFTGVATMANAVLEDVAVAHQGATVMVHYVIRGGQLVAAGS